MSEVYSIFPLPTSTRAQIEFSSLIQAMVHHPKGEMHILMRYVPEDGLPPKLFVGKAVINEVEQEYMIMTRVRIHSLAPESFGWSNLSRTMI